MTDKDKELFCFSQSDFSKQCYSAHNASGTTLVLFMFSVIYVPTSESPNKKEMNKKRYVRVISRA